MNTFETTANSTYRSIASTVIRSEADLRHSEDPFAVTICCIPNPAIGVAAHRPQEGLPEPALLVATAMTSLLKEQQDYFAGHIPATAAISIVVTEAVELAVVVAVD